MFRRILFALTALACLISPGTGCKAKPTYKVQDCCRA